MKYILFAAILLFSLPLMAADELVVTGDDCDVIGMHAPDDDVAFKPGVDVDGAEVESADLNKNEIALPDKISIPIVLEFKRDQTVPPVNGVKIGVLKHDAQLGSLSYDIKTRELFFDGKKLSDGNQHAIAEACNKIKSKKY